MASYVNCKLFATATVLAQPVTVTALSCVAALSCIKNCGLLVHLDT